MSNKVKICIMISNLPQGGSERQTINLIKGLNPLRYDITFLIYYPFDEIFYKEIYELPINLIIRKTKTKNKIFRTIDNALFISKFLKENSFDVIYTLLFHNGFWIRLMAPKKYNNRIIFSVRSSLKDASKLFLYFERFFIKKSFVISNSSNSTNQYVHLVGYEYKDKISTIYNGIDTDKFGMSNIPVLSDRIIIGTVGRQVDVKNQIQLLNVIDRLKDTFSIHFYLIGDKRANKAEENHQYIIDNSLEDIVFNYDSLPNIEDYYKKFNIFVLPSLHEGCPNALLEAMLSNCLCIVSKGANSDQFITDGVNGLEYDGTIEMLESKLKYAITLLQNNNAIEIINNGHNYVYDKFSNEKMVDNYQRIFENIVKIKK